MAIKGYLSGNHFNRLSVWIGFDSMFTDSVVLLARFTITEDLIWVFSRVQQRINSVAGRSISSEYPSIST
ncbi:MAG TPA: hypothetical protein VHP35_03940 [Terriglobia bacterium]|jgi:hypothetical protein|nr:hypothetical protein [Terriglobia bacterium]